MDNIDIAAALRYCNSYTRLPTLLSLFDRIDMLPEGDEWSALFSEWFRALGREWTVCDAITQFGYELYEMIGEAFGMWPLLMTDEEQATLAGLPEEMTIYRGCGSQNADGICWSLDRSVAEKFPRLNRYEVPDPILITATVQRDDIVALKLERQEAEVITFWAKEQSRRIL